MKKTNVISLWFTVTYINLPKYTLALFRHPLLGQLQSPPVLSFIMFHSLYCSSVLSKTHLLLYLRTNIVLMPTAVVTIFYRGCFFPHPNIYAHKSDKHYVQLFRCSDARFKTLKPKKKFLLPYLIPKVLQNIFNLFHLPKFF